MSGRKIARRLTEVARDPGECTGVRELAEWALRAEGDGADLAELEEIVVGLADASGMPTLPAPTDADGNAVRVGDVLYAMKCRHTGERHGDIPFVVASLAFDGDTWTASGLVGIRANLNDCRLMRFASGERPNET